MATNAPNSAPEAGKLGPWVPRGWRGDPVPAVAPVVLPPAKIMTDTSNGASRRVPVSRGR